MGYSHLIVDRTDEFRDLAEQHGVEISDVGLYDDITIANGRDGSSTNDPSSSSSNPNANPLSGKSGDKKSGEIPFLEVFFADVKKVQRLIEDVQASTEDVDACTDLLLEAVTQKKEEAAAEQLEEVMTRGTVVVS